MFTKLEKLKQRYEDISLKLSGGELKYASKEYLDLAKEHSSLEKVVQLYNKYTETMKKLNDTKDLIISSSDSELLELAKDEINDLEKKINRLIDELKLALYPKDPNSNKNVIMEIRAGTGGDEAALFAADLYRMYYRFSERNKWKIEILNSNETEVGGYKEIIFSVSGKEVYDKLKFEMGGHRVQRIPLTESGGRIHTSAVTVAVLPEVEETEIQIQANDLRIDVFRSSGPGGQSVNTTDSAVRITHVPSGIVVQCQDEKSQHKNKAKALRVLRARLQEKISLDQKKEIAEERKLQIGSGDRSERIRTYNYPQNRFTDHRINFSIYNRLESILNGEIDEIVDALTKFEKEKIVSNLSNV